MHLHEEVMKLRRELSMTLSICYCFRFSVQHYYTISVDHVAIARPYDQGSDLDPKGQCLMNPTRITDSIIGIPVDKNCGSILGRYYYADAEI